MTYEEFVRTPLEKVSLNDLQDALGLSGRGPSEAAREGLTVDYKSVEIPDEIAWHVAALANTMGGHLFLGVAESNQLPTKLVGVHTGGELKAHVEDLVYPRLKPVVPYDLRLFELPNGHQVAAMRVPPFARRSVRALRRAKDGKWRWKLPQRLPAGRTVEATKEEILNRAGARITPDATLNSVRQAFGSFHRDWFGFVASPVRSLGGRGVRLDGAEERKFARLVHDAFWWEFPRGHTSNVESRSGYSECSGGINTNTRWLVYEAGSLAYFREWFLGASSFSLYGAAFEMLQLLSLARTWLGGRLGYWGEIHVASWWDFPAAPLDPRWYTTQKLKGERLVAVPWPQESSTLRNVFPTTTLVAHQRSMHDAIDELCVFRLNTAATRIVAGILNEHLRRRLGVSPDLNILRQQVDNQWIGMLEGQAWEETRQAFVPPWNGGRLQE